MPICARLHSFSPFVAVALLLAAAGALAADESGPPAGLSSCQAIDTPSERLACYDRLAGRTAPAKPSNAASGAVVAEEPAAPRGPAPAPAPAVAAAGSGLTASPPSFLSRFWELDDTDKRGSFNFIGYRPNYLLPLHAMSRLNTDPSSPTRAATALPGYRRVETKLQLSLRTKLIEGLLLPGADLWFGYTQQSSWQLWSPSISSPFRNTDYEPELIYVVPLPETMRALPAGWQWRYLQIAAVHQSNGQSDPLSRSWNRVSFGTGLERGELSLTARVAARLHENRDDDDNPDLLAYRGRNEVIAAWTPGLATAALQWRGSLKRLSRGSLQFDWSYPVRREQPNGLRWYAQIFTGYAETLIDYNFRQTSIGAGLTFFNF